MKFSPHLGFSVVSLHCYVFNYRTVYVEKNHELVKNSPSLKYKPKINMTLIPSKELSTLNRTFKYQKVRFNVSKLSASKQNTIRNKTDRHSKQHRKKWQPKAKIKTINSHDTDFVEKLLIIALSYTILI